MVWLHISTFQLLLNIFSGFSTTSWQQHPDFEIFGMDTNLNECPVLPDNMQVRVYHSASAIYHAPSDLSGIGGMHQEYIRSTPSWHRGPPRHDTVFIERDPDALGFLGLGVAQVRLFFSFSFHSTCYNCALVHWFECYRDSPCPITGMWQVQPDYAANRKQLHTVIHIDSILRAAHLIRIYGLSHIPYHLTPSLSLQAFCSYYVNKYADHQAHEIAF